MIKQYKLRFYNFKLVILLTAISLFGVQLVASASPDLRNKQLLGVVMGLVLLVILSLMDYSWILNFQWIMYGFNLLMLIGVRLFGSEAGGASRWLDIGGFRFQPTELSKVIIILFFAKFFMDHEDDINTFRVLAESVLLLAVPLALIYAQPDMKNTITVTIIFCILLYIAGLSYKIIGGAILIAVPLLIIFLSIVVEDIEQQNNSKTAIASGELVGKKLTGDDQVSSVNAGNFVAENQTDFIFAVAGEEYGFIGCTTLVALLLLISVECIRMSLRAKDLAGKIICCGIGSVVAIQSFLNICVATGLAPNTGTPLPFVSYGLTSLVSLFIGMGLVMNVGLQSSTYNKELKRKEIDKKEEYL